MLDTNSITAPTTCKPTKPYPDFPLTPHATGYWCKKIKRKVRYFGRWDDPEGALQEYLDFLAGKRTKKSGTAADRPAKPYPEFPLFAHASGQWAKKIRGKMYYFGKWFDPDAALDEYTRVEEALHAGRKPKPDIADGATVKDVCNAYLRHKQNQVDNRERSPRTFASCLLAATMLVDQFGKTRRADDLGPDDFAELRNHMAKRWGFLRVRDFIGFTRSIFKFAVDEGLMDRTPRYGQGFARPGKKTIQEERNKGGKRMLEAEEIRTLLAAAKQPLKTMILLAINCAFGNTDCATVPLSAIDLEKGWIEYPRPKTAVKRRCPLWPQTVEAIREWLTIRPEPVDPANAGLLFVTQKRKGSWHKPINDDPITKETRKLMNSVSITGHRGFYGLRHSFETIAGESRDQVAVDHVMGHSRGDMASHYRERISDDRLEDVVHVVHDWLFDEPTGEIPDVLPMRRAN